MSIVPVRLLLLLFICCFKKGGLLKNCSFLKQELHIYVCPKISGLKDKTISIVNLYGWPGGATPCPRSRGCAAQEGLQELSHVEVRKCGGKEIPLVQGKEQWLHFAGAAVKRYPTPKVRETQVTWKVLLEGVRGQAHKTILTEN